VGKGLKYYCKYRVNHNHPRDANYRDWDNGDIVIDVNIETDDDILSLKQSLIEKHSSKHPGFSHSCEIMGLWILE
jgi:hypothetical protein